MPVLETTSFFAALELLLLLLLTNFLLTGRLVVTPRFLPDRADLERRLLRCLCEFASGLLRTLRFRTGGLLLGLRRRFTLAAERLRLR